MVDHDQLARILWLQDGLITRKQALAVGMSAKAIRYALRDGGPWQVVLRGVYATFTGPLGDLHRLRAATLHAGADSRVTHAWACWMAGLSYGPQRADVIVLQIPRTSRARPTGFVELTHRSYDATQYDEWVDPAMARDVGRLIGMSYEPSDALAGAARPGVIRMVPVARAVIDTLTKVRWLPVDWQMDCRHDEGCPQCWRGVTHRASAVRNTRALMCEAVQRNKCTVDELAAELSTTRRIDTAIVRSVLGDLAAGCRSAPECELRDLVATSAILPQPRWNRVLPGARGIYPDACWPEARLVVEVDSRAFHGFGDAPARTERRRARYAELGWTVFPVAPSRIRREPDRVLAEIEAAYLAGVARNTRHA
ncbi:hypothetical protein [Phytoactinopolyspora halotolerans]|uniref:DUF559 domain-containing protein n=1 Tax=Phytoactinopolyspora halotolerans TaxID=1981512 RepID=A0A6L9SCX6_9ACTN|nr:hypothetical protein [Phytoactinopolyspora halotolerans]NEE02869.1 hypothetical protein [Phytoactinopolyspora halotolerans]